MSKRGDIIRHVFAGQQDPLSKIMVQTGDDTSPNGAISAPQGTFFLVDYPNDNADKDVYINTDGSTAWTQIHNDV